MIVLTRDSCHACQSTSTLGASEFFANISETVKGTMLKFLWAVQRGAMQLLPSIHFFPIVHRLAEKNNKNQKNCSVLQLLRFILK